MSLEFEGISKLYIVITIPNIMLTRIIDTSNVDMKDPLIQRELETDLRRMDRLRHDGAPENSNAYRVTVTPSVKTYYPGLHRFRFFIQYGELHGEQFKPIGDTVRYQSETLPMLD